MSAEEGQLVVAYWDIRGLCAPLRMMCVYAGVKYEAKLLTIAQNESGGWDSPWWGLKGALKERNPLINLPYVVDGDRVVTQTNACLTYLGRKFNLNGKSEDELIKVEQCLSQAMDLRNDCVKLFYSPAEQIEAGHEKFIKDTITPNYTKFNDWLNFNKTDFLAGAEPTSPDFHLAELLDQLELYAKQYKLESFLTKYPVLKEYLARFQALPKIQEYLGSDLHKLACNNIMAGWRGVSQ